MKKVVYLLSMVFFLGCENFAETFYSTRIENNSQDTIKVCQSFNYPDTSMSISKPHIITVLPYDVGDLFSSSALEEKNDTIIFFIIDQEVYRENEWSKIRDDYNILSRIDVSIPDIKANYFTIRYP